MTVTVPRRPGRRHVAGLRARLPGLMWDLGNTPLSVERTFIEFLNEFRAVPRRFQGA